MVNLKQRYDEYHQENPKAYLRNAAKALACTEAQLLAIKQGTTCLKNDFQGILKQLESLGEVMCVTRNDACVHERAGVYSNVSFEGNERHQVGLAVNPDIDTRLFMNSWAYAFSCNEEGKMSIQFFDVYGSSVHKIFVKDKSKAEAFEKLTNQFKVEAFEILPQAPKEPRVELPDSKINVEQFRKDWSELKDTHAFFPMLMKHKVSRTQALRLAEKKFAYKVENNSARRILELARDSKCEIMVFVGNSGCIQIHTGLVENLKDSHGWFNVLDEKFSMHLNEAEITQCWVTVKPTVDGDVHALEVFDKKGEMIVQFFGKRKPGVPELQSWRDIIKQI